MDEYQTGYQIFTASAVLKSSGKPMAVYSVYTNSDGVGGGLVRLYNGPVADSQTTVFSFVESAASVNGLHVLAGGQGVVFPLGCFVELAANIDYVTVSYQSLGA